MQLLVKQVNKNDRAKVTFFKQSFLRLSCLLLLVSGVEKVAADNNRLCTLYSQKSQSGLSYFYSIMRDFKSNKLISYSALIEDLQEKRQYCSLSSMEQQRIDTSICEVGEYLYFFHNQEIDHQLRFFESDGKFHKVPVTVWLDDIGNNHCSYSYKTVYHLSSLVNPFHPQVNQPLLTAEIQNNKKITKIKEFDASKLTFSAKQINHFPEIVNKAYQQLVISFKHVIPDFMFIDFVDKPEKESQ